MITLLCVLVIFAQKTPFEVRFCPPVLCNVPSVVVCAEQSNHRRALAPAGPTIFLYWLPRASADDFLHKFCLFGIEPTFVIRYAKTMLPRIKIVKVVCFTQRVKCQTNGRLDYVIAQLVNLSLNCLFQCIKSIWTRSPVWRMLPHSHPFRPSWRFVDPSHQ